MADLQSRPLIELNLDTREITITKNIKYYDIDKNIANIFLQIYREDDTGLRSYLTKEELDSFTGKIFAIKPVTNDFLEITGINTMEFESDNGGGVLRFIIPAEYTNRNGIVKCEIHVSKNNELLASDRFVYNVKQSLVTEFDDNLLEDLDFPILQQLIKNVQKANNIDDDTSSLITTYSGTKIENIKTEIYTKMNNISMLNSDNLANDIIKAINLNRKLRIIQQGIEFNELFKFTGTGTEVLELEFNPKSLITSNYAGTEKKPIFHFDNLKTIKITNMSIEYTHPTNDEAMINLHHLLSITNCENVIIDNCKFKGSHFAGLYINGCGKVTITNTQATHNYFGGILYANSNYVLVDKCDLSYNGWSNHPEKGYGIAQEFKQPSCNKVIITNCNCSFNIRKGIDFHEFSNAIVTGNHLENNGLYGIDVIAGNANGGEVIISDNIIINQPLSDYSTGAAIAVVCYEEYTINNISISNNIIRNIYTNGILVETNATHNISIANNIIEYIYDGFGSTTSCIRIKETVNPSYTVKIIGNIVKSKTVHGILVERCTKLYVENNSIRNEQNSYCLMFPNKDGNPSKVPYAVIKGNEFFFKKDYFINGWNLKSSNGVITDNRCKDYVFLDNVVTNSDGTANSTTYALWEQVQGNRIAYSTALKNTTPSENNWVAGDKIIGINDHTYGYIGKVCVESGSPGVWKPFGKIDIGSV